jgi:hypothetical protein
MIITHPSEIIHKIEVKVHQQLEIRINKELNKLNKHRINHNTLK